MSSAGLQITNRYIDRCISGAKGCHERPEPKGEASLSIGDREHRVLIVSDKNGQNLGGLLSRSRWHPLIGRCQVRPASSVMTLASSPLGGGAAGSQ